MIKNFDVLKRHILFENIEEGKLFEVLESLEAHERDYVKNQVIFSAGGRMTEIGVLVKGAAHLSVCDAQGQRMILRELSTGDSFGESIVLTGIDNIIAITAITKCTVVFLSLKSIVEGRPFPCEWEVRMNLTRLLAQSNIALLMKNDIISKKTIRERLTMYLYYQSLATSSVTIKTFFTKEELADYLCVNRSALSRELSKMQKEGIVVSTKNKFVINMEKIGKVIF